MTVHQALLNGDGALRKRLHVQTKLSTKRFQILELWQVKRPDNSLISL